MKSYPMKSSGASDEEIADAVAKQLHFRKEQALDRVRKLVTDQCVQTKKGRSLSAFRLQPYEPYGRQ